MQRTAPIMVYNCKVVLSVVGEAPAYWTNQNGVDTFNMTNNILSSFIQEEKKSASLLSKNSSIKERSKGPGPENSTYEKRTKRQLSKSCQPWCGWCTTFHDSVLSANSFVPRVCVHGDTISSPKHKHKILAN